MKFEADESSVADLESFFDRWSDSVHSVFIYVLSVLFNLLQFIK